MLLKKIKKIHLLVFLGLCVLLAIGYQGWQYARQLEVRLFALDAQTGHVQWSIPLTYYSDGVSYNHPMVNGNRVLAYGHLRLNRDYALEQLAFDATAGAVVWEFVFPRFSYVNGVRLAADEDVVVEALHDGHETLTIVDAATGELLWSIAHADLSSHSETVALTGDWLVAITNDRHDDGVSQPSLKALDKRTGELLWQTDLNATFGGQAIDDIDSGDPALVANDRLIFVIGPKKINAFGLQSGSFLSSIDTGRHVFHLQLAETTLYYDIAESFTAYDITTNTPLWTFSPPLIEPYERPYIHGFQVFGQVIYVGGTYHDPSSDDKQTWLFALDASDGHELWRKLVGELADDFTNQVRAVEYLRPASYGDSIFVTNYLNKRCDLAALSTGDGSERWHFPLWFLNLPATDGSRVFVIDGGPRWRNWLANLNPTWHGTTTDCIDTMFRD